MAKSAHHLAQFSLLITIFCTVNRVAGYSSNYKYYTTKKSKCLNPPRTARRVENFIGECQEEVKNKLVNEAYQILKEEGAMDQPKIIENNEYAFNLVQNLNEKPIEQWPNDDWLSTPSPESQQSHEEQYPLEYSYIELTTTTPQIESRKKRVARLMHRIRRIGDIGSDVSIYHPTLVPYEDKRIAGCLLHCVYAKNNAIDKNGWPTLDGLVNFYSEGVNEHGFFMATLRSVNLCLRAVTNKYKVDRRKLPQQGESCDVAFDVFDCISDQITGYCLDQYE